MLPRLLIPGVVAMALGIFLASCGDGPTEPAPVCSYALSPTSRTVEADGGTGTVSLATTAGCTWTAAASASWITITSGSSGSGAGTVAYSVQANSATSSRSGALTIGGQTFTLTQQGRAPAVCAYTLSPSSAEFNKDAATGTFGVSAPAECDWTAASSASWLVVSSGAGSGNGTVSYSITRNFDVVERIATVSVADQAFTVRQAGDVVTVCTYSVAPVEFAPCMPASSVTATVTTQAGCSWTAAPNASWLGLPSGGSGTGSSVITITFSDNYDAPREGIVMVRWPTPTAGQNIRLAQAGCTYAVSRNAFSFTSSGGSGTFDVLQESVPNTCGGATQDRCVWTAASNVPWITVTSSMPRTGDNPVAFTVAANTGAAREGRITVRDKVVVISQAAQ